jgi:DNA polymerase III gamma/tau subunit
MESNQTRNLSVALRPQSLKEFIGGAKVLDQVRSFIREQRIPTAILLSGPTGCGKTTLARIITSEIDGDPVEANAADDTGVDAARSLGEQAQHMSLLNSHKVIILDEAHQLTKQAQSALLKHVEDAPPSTVWIFCTTEPSKLLPTLRGRCVSFALGGLTDDQTPLLVSRGLAYLNKNSGATPATEDFIKLLARENVRSPRAILMATEAFARGAEPLAAIFGSAESPNAFEIAKAAAKQDWKAICKLLTGATAEEAMTIRIVCANYFKSALLRGADCTFYSKAIVYLTESVPAIDVFGLAELSAKLSYVCHHLDAPRSS